MTDNTQELDDILNVLYMQGEDIGKLEYGSATHQITAVSGAKQAILDWHNKQIEATTKRLNDLWATIMIDEVGSEKAFAYREAIESQLKESK